MSKESKEKKINNDKEEKASEKEPEKVIQVNQESKSNQLKCPNCGSSEVQPNPKTGKLRCNYCYSEFDGKELVGVENNLKNLKGKVRGSGATDIKKDVDDVVTLKCGSCGAEVVIDTANAPHARCHWCRSILSINSQIENGSIPDALLPFQTRKEEAEEKIKEFVGKRKFFANPTFKKEFTTDNIMGVYFPYLLVDANCHASFKGEGEHLVRRYTVGSGDDQETRYDADLYKVEREFDITMDDLSIESNSTRLDKTSNEQTNNIINSIMPFDTENCISYQSNYLVGYTSERRDMNIEDIEEKVNLQLKDIARFSAKEDAKFYDRGIKWTTEDFKVVGTQWIAAYLPVWLYSYQEVKGNKKVLHYVAVNARTNETMGSVPINNPLLLLISTIIEIISGTLGLFLFLTASGKDDDDSTGFLLLFLAGFIFYGIMYARYRNKSARHTYEKETKKEITNMKRVDELIKREKGLRDASMKGHNEDKIEGDTISKNLLDKIKKKNIKNIYNIKDRVKIFLILFFSVRLYFFDKNNMMIMVII